MKDPLISIIVPVYKVEPYLTKCINSMLNQLYNNIEIILVDDGSPDNCGVICDEFAEKDKRVRVIHKKNGGQAEARNVGLDMARGEYITFIDSDDYVSNDYISHLYQLIEKYDVPISITDLIYFNKGDSPKISERTFGVKLMTKDESLISLFYQKDFDTSPCGKMYHRSFFDEFHIRFPMGIYEDTATIYRILMLSNRCVFSGHKVYYYLLRNDSTEGSPFSSFKHEKSLQVLNQLENDYDLMSPLVKKALDCRITSFAFHILLEVPKKQFQMRKDFWLIIKERRTRVLFDFNARLKTRIACFLSFFGLWLVDAFSSFGKTRK